MLYTSFKSTMWFLHLCLSVLYRTRLNEELLIPRFWISDVFNQWVWTDGTEITFSSNNSRGPFSSFSIKPSNGHLVGNILCLKNLWISAIIHWIINSKSFYNNVLPTKIINMCLFNYIKLLKLKILKFTEVGTDVRRPESSALPPLIFRFGA